MISVVSPDGKLQAPPAYVVLELRVCNWGVCCMCWGRGMMCCCGKFGFSALKRICCTCICTIDLILGSSFFTLTAHNSKNMSSAVFSDCFLKISSLFFSLSCILFFCLSKRSLIMSTSSMFHFFFDQVLYLPVWKMIHLVMGCHCKAQQSLALDA